MTAGVWVNCLSSLMVFLPFFVVLTTLGVLGITPISGFDRSASEITNSFGLFVVAAFFSCFYCGEFWK